MTQSENNHLNGEEEVNAEEQNNNPDLAPSQPEEREPQEVRITDIELEKLREEASDYKDKYQRSLAEAENSRKRLHKERQELIQYALQNMTIDFLTPIDNLEQALKFAQSANAEVKHWAIGFEMILNQFKEALESNGATYFPSQGLRFDPLKHEALEMVETTEFEPGIVVAESLRGYKMGERIIRPAKVKVAKAPEKKEDHKNEEKFN